jgi:hypothetical protein
VNGRGLLVHSSAREVDRRADRLKRTIGGMKPTPERPLSKAERQALDAIEAGFAAERRARRRRRRIVVLSVCTAALAAIGLAAPQAALTLSAAIAVAFAGPMMMALCWRMARPD